MKKKLLALILVLLVIPAVFAAAAQTGFAESRMDFHYAVIGGDQTLTIRSHVEPGGRGGYTDALYAVELTGRETKQELDAVAVRLLEDGVQPVWSGSMHCFHLGSYTADPQFSMTASDYAPGSYLYVCYAFACDGGDYNHYPLPFYERISTMSVRVTSEARGLELSYALTDAQAQQLSLTDGSSADLDPGKGPYTLELVSQVAHPVERILDIRADFPGEQAAAPFRFDGETMALTPELCGSGSLTVTIGNYLDDTVRTEQLRLRVPCTPRPAPTVLTPNTCTEDGLAVYHCIGHGINCETAFEEVVLPATGHTLFSVSQYVEKPTATLPGIGMGTCKNCGLIGVEQPVPPIFSDVVPDGFYSRALDHCYAKGWVSGVTESTFAPENPCVRAQVVTFLWRAAGCPKPVTRDNPFQDVTESDFYYDAVLWAVEEGITTGTDGSHFSPLGVCNRAQVVTFLWRAFGQPEAGVTEHPFGDVQTGSWYEQPVLWAVEKGITSGMTATTFGPIASCNRAQIVTFLYRAYAE